jgi:hypothetical protein
MALIQEVMVDGMVSPEKLAAILLTTKAQLASTAGLSRDAVSKSARIRQRSTQTRIREVAEILNRVAEWAGSPVAAFAWYRSQPIPSLGDKTAEELVREGRAELVRRYLARVADGGYA